MSGILFICIVLVASILQTSTGFGFSIIATPFLLLLFAPETAVQLNLILSIVISLALFVKMMADIRFSIVKRLMIGSFAGAPIGVALMAVVAADILKVGVGLFLIGVTIVLMAKFTLKQTASRDVAAGSFSGLLTASIGMPGPPLIAYFSGARMSKETTRATTLAFFLVIYPISFALQFVFVGVDQEVWRLSIMAFPFVVGGLIIGQLLFKRISQRLFQFITYALLLVAGVCLLIEVVY